MQTGSMVWICEPTGLCGFLAEWLASFATVIQGLRNPAGSSVKRGWIEVLNFYAPSGFSAHLYGCDHVREYTFPLDAEGVQYEIMVVSNCVVRDSWNVRCFRWRETVALMKAMDKLRSSWDIRVPTDI